MNQFSLDPRLLKDVTTALDVTNCHYRLLSAIERDVLDQWWQVHFPLTSWGRVQWSAISGCVCKEWSEKWKDLVDHFHTLCEAEALASPEVIVVWSNLLRPALGCTLHVVRDHAATIFEADFDTWIICPEQKWCIEIYHEGEMCFGRVGGA